MRPDLWIGVTFEVLHILGTDEVAILANWLWMLCYLKKAEAEDLMSHGPIWSSAVVFLVSSSLRHFLTKFFDTGGIEKHTYLEILLLQNFFSSLKLFSITGSFNFVVMLVKKSLKTFAMSLSSVTMVSFTRSEWIFLSDLCVFFQWVHWRLSKCRFCHWFCFQAMIDNNFV